MSSTTDEQIPGEDQTASARNTTSVIRSVKSKIGPTAAKPLACVEEVKELLESSDVVVIGFFKKEGVFLDAASALDDTPFGIVSEDAVFEEYKMKDDEILMLKKFDEGRVEYDGEFELQALKSWIQLNSLPLVREFTRASIGELLFGGGEYTLLFIRKSSDIFQTHYESFLEAARILRGKIHFGLIDADNLTILALFQVKREHVPCLRLISLDDGITKFLESELVDITTENVVKFTECYLDKKLIVPAEYNAAEEGEGEAEEGEGEAEEGQGESEEGEGEAEEGQGESEEGEGEAEEGQGETVEGGLYQLNRELQDEIATLLEANRDLRRLLDSVLQQTEGRRQQTDGTPQAMEALRHAPAGASSSPPPAGTPSPPRVPPTSPFPPTQSLPGSPLPSRVISDDK